MYFKFHINSLSILYICIYISTCLRPSRHRAFPQDQKTSKICPKLLRNGAWEALGITWAPKCLPNLLKIALNWTLGASGDHLGTKMPPKSDQNCSKLDLGGLWGPLGTPLASPWSTPGAQDAKKTKKRWFVCGQMWLKHSK